MDCEEAMRLVDAGREGRSSPGDQKGLAEHLARCERCRAEKAKALRLDEVLRSVPAPRVERTRLKAALQAVRRQIRGRELIERRKRRNLAVAIGLAASIVVAVGAAVLGLGGPEPGDRGAQPGRHAASRKSRTIRTEERVARRGGEVAPQREGEAPPAAAREHPPARAARSAVDRRPAGSSADWGDELVAKLVRADLELSEATGSARKAVIFSAMSGDVLAELKELAGRGDEDATRLLGAGYAKLVRDGVLPNVRLARAPDDRPGLSRVVDSLRRDGEVLRGLVSKARGGGRGLFAEALAASEECRGAAEQRLEALGSGPARAL